MTAFFKFAFLAIISLGLMPLLSSCENSPAKTFKSYLLVKIDVKHKIFFIQSQCDYTNKQVFMFKKIKTMG